jgi:serine/threonine protein kinase
LHDRFIGTNLLGYIVVEKIGEGGMGKVYLAENESIGQKVAVKVLDPLLARSEELRERFTQEARIQVSLQHQNIVRVLSAQITGDLCFLILEHIEGQSLDKVLARRGKLPVDEAVQIMRQVLDAVGYAHSRGIVHRDIKPANILVCADGTAKVTDFGIAKVLGDARLTRTGTSMGSPAYMSPEQVLGKKDADHRTDIYSLGAMLFEIITGRPPFVIEETAVSDSDYLIKTAHVQSTPTSPATLVPGLPNGIATTILKALEKSPQSRFESCAEFYASFSKPEPQQKQEMTTTPKAFSRPIATLALYLAIPAVSVLLFKYWHSSQRENQVHTEPVAAATATPWEPPKEAFESVARSKTAQTNPATVPTPTPRLLSEREKLGGGTQDTQQPLTPPAPQPEPAKEECTALGASKIDPAPTDAERAKCTEYGGGSACQTNCWYLDFYSKIKAAVNGGQAQPQPNPQPASTTCTVTSNGLNIRQSPGGTTVATLDNGEQCTKLGEQDGWFKVKYQGFEGYAWGDYLSCN